MDEDKNRNLNNDIQVFEHLMLQTYKSAPDGLQNQNEEPQFKTSRELQYMVRESCEPTVAEISQSMIRMKFDGISKAGTYYWKLYERQV